MAYILDILGSSLTRDFQDDRRSHAVRHMQVEADGTTALPNDETGTSAAIDRILEQTEPGGHPGLPNLPRRSATAVRLGPTKARVALHYRHQLLNFSTDPLPTFVRATYDDIDLPVKWWNSTATYDSTYGFPTGPVAKDGDGKVEPFFWDRKGARILIPALLTSHPWPDVGGLLNRINSDPITMLFTAGQYEVLPYQMKFSGLHTTEISTSDGTRFPTHYQFDFCIEGFYQQVLADPFVSHTAIQPIHPAYRPAAFSGAFDF